MKTDHYWPVSFDADATHARRMKLPGFADAYNALADIELARSRYKQMMRTR
jgi:hypothetical protein